MSDQTIALLFTIGISAGVLIACFFGIRKALRTGQVRYSGNRSNLVARTYTRHETPFMFWAGIGVICFVALITILASLVFMLGVYGIEV